MRPSTEDARAEVPAVARDVPEERAHEASKRLAGKVAIVTGSTRGLGRHLALLFAREGAQVVVTGRTAQPGVLPGTLAETVNEIEVGGGSGYAVRCDLADERQIRDLVDTVLARSGRIDLVVGNAVARVPTKLIDTSSEAMEWVLRVNLLAAFHLCRYTLPSMIERRSGSIITIKSSDSLTPAHDREMGNSPYRVSKAALTMFTVELAPEVRPFGVAVNGYYPGHLVSDAHTAIRRERSRLYGTDQRRSGDPPAACDESIVYLATRTAEAMSGQLVRRVDFGRTWGPRGA